MKHRISCKVCRREGVSLCGREKCAFKRRPYPPGVHGPTGNTRQSDFGKQLREKQKAKRLYGLSENQFSNLFKKATSKKGDTGETLVRELELRLDNVIFRSGFARSRAAARQLVGHAHFDVNGKKVNIPSYRVKSGDIIRVRANKQGKAPWKNIVDAMKNYQAVSWLAVEPKDFTAKVTGVPTSDEMKQPFNPKMIVEFYSR
jgi:small subunit ribosomal protein S4